VPQEVPTSYWVDSTSAPAFPRLDEPVVVDVAVIGAGITGITAATLLKEGGKTVALLESKEVLCGVTGYTTAKLTSGHNLIYAAISGTFGQRAARLYAEANEAAIVHVAAVAEARKIACDLERTSNYVYAEAREDVEKVRDEVKAARDAGLNVSFVEETPLPFPVAGAVRQEGQAQFHPRKYLLPLAESIPGDGSCVFQETRALSVEDGDPCRVRTNRGEVIARDVIVATHLSILDRGLYFAKTSPKRSYVLGIPVDEAEAPEGMFISTESPIHSIRHTRFDGRRLLMIGGEGHKTGQDEDTRRRYSSLEEWARARFELGPVEYRWSTQDNYSADRVPYVGKLGRRSDHVYVATGFNGWGMTNGTVAGLLLCDAILGKPNPWAEVYDSTRLPPFRALGRLAKENANVGKRWVGDRLPGRQRSAAGLAPGEGAIVSLGSERAAVYKEEDGSLISLSPVCTHLGCIVGWNTAEKTWDCPCHGSRFDPRGRVIQGPAVQNLPRKNVGPASR
jgi:glycine/D-amino acid oxidase-like deaminating enzyme/nitrite reductase/ring-hydroxylating ferredoxin subunit